MQDKSIWATSKQIAGWICSCALHLSLVLSQRLWRQREVHDGEEGPDDKVERCDQEEAEEHPVNVRVGAQACDDGFPCRSQQSHHGDGGEEGEGYVLEHAAANANNSFFNYSCLSLALFSI